MPARKRVRLVIDVNVLVSALISQDGGFLRSVFNKQRFTVLVSPELIGEFTEVVHRPRMRKYFTIPEAERAVARLVGLSQALAKDPPVTAVSRDPKDDYLLALAAKGNADLLISGDDDLLVLKKHGRTRILTPTAFRMEFLA